MATPLCRHFGPCGGCDWQDVRYPDQLARKQHRLDARLRDALGEDAPPIDPIVGMPVDDTGWPWHFRHKASFVFGESADRRSLSVGHYARDSHTVVGISECPVHAPRANRLAFALHAHLARAQVPAAGPALRGVLRHLVVRTTRDGREVGAMLVVARNDKSLRKPIKEFLATEEAPDGFYLNIHERADSFMIGRETMRLAGRSHVKEKVGSASYLLSPTAFFQTNIDAAAVLVQLVLDALPATAPQRVLDLYAGSGLFTVSLVQRGHQVTAVEEHRQAVEDAAANLRLNRLSEEKVRLRAERVEDAVERFRPGSFDAVILDPPRQGCAPAAIERIFAGAIAPRVVYVSCNPEALAGELPRILDAGYRIDRVQPVDMFPHTTHIETVVTFSRPSSARRRASAPALPDRPTPRARQR